METSLLDRFAAGGGQLRKAVAGLDRTDMLARPVPGTWSIQEIVIHLQDSDLIGTDRMKRVIAEPNPTLVGYDESLFIKNLHTDQQDPQAAVEIFDLNRKQISTVLKLLEPEVFERSGVHTERGPVTLRILLEDYVQHLDHHLKFLLHKRALLGKAVD